MTPYYADDSVTLHHGASLDVLAELPDASVDCCVTSPPYYGLRDYGVEGQQGLEATPAEYVAGMVAVFAQVRRVLADDGTLWLNIGDSYATTPRGNDNGWDKSRISNPGRVQKAQRAAMRVRDFDRPAKNLLGIPWRVAFALQDDGWILRNAIVWHKPNAMPESVADRLSTRHELMFMFSKSPRYWFDLDPIREPLARPEALDEGIVFGGKHADDKTRRGNTYGSRAGRVEATPPGNTPQTNFGPIGVRNGKFHEKGRNPGDVWTIPTQPFPGAHFAVMPQALAARAVQAGCKPGGTVLDPYSGSGTTGLAAARHGRKYVGIDLNADYLDLSLRTRLAQAAMFDEEVGA